MRLSIVVAALALGMLVTAGSSLAIVEAVATVASATQSSLDAGMGYADSTTGLPVSDTTYDALDAAYAVAGPPANAGLAVASQILADVNAKESVVTSAATAVGANAMGQANAGEALVAAIASNYVATANAVLALELSAVQVTPLVNVAVSNVIFAKESGESIAIGAANAAVADPEQLAQDPAAAPTALGALAVTIALEKQAAVIAYANSILAA